MTDTDTATQEAPAADTPAPARKRIMPDGFIGQPLGRREMEIYLRLVHETMDVAEILTAQLRAIEIIAAHDKIGRDRGQE
jgi:hypothetical protein